MAPLHVRRLRRTHPSWVLGVGSKDICYTKTTGLDMIRSTEVREVNLGVDFVNRLCVQHSADNGATWGPREWILNYQQVGESAIAYNNLYFFLDPDNGILLRFYHRQVQRAGDKGNAMHIAHWAHMFVQISRDAGKTWESPQQVIQQGAEYDFFHWARDIIIGRNGGMFCWGHMKKLPDGTIFFPFLTFPVEPTGNLYNPAGAYTYTVIGVLLGRWRVDLSGIDWDLGDWFSVPPEQSTRGVAEPATALLDDGRIVMLMRGSNAPAYELPGVKWMTVSTNGGRSWSEGRPVTYDDGSVLYSPACGSKIIRSSKNGRYYWLCNILDHNPQGNSPRYPLRVAEFDPVSLTVRKDTVTLIATREENEPVDIQVCGDVSYEDRVTKNIMVLPKSDVLATEYWYEVVIPDA